jgi:hypothetical protein
MKFSLYVTFFAVLFSFSSCSNEFDLVEEKRDIPVVYCLLDYEAPIQFLRLEKAFVSPTTAATVLAKSPDSLYYKNAVVKMIRTSKGVKNEFILKEVDGAQEGYPRKDGVFATAPNKLYKISSSEMVLTPGDIVELKIETGEGPTITSTTNIISKVIPSKPGSGQVSFTELKNDNLTWNTNNTTGGILHTIDLYFRYTEVLNGTETKKTAYWPIVKNAENENHLLAPGEFLTFLSANIEKNSSAKRYFEGIDYFIFSGDQNLAKFLLVAQANNGITGSGEVPTFSNLNRGLGIFGSKAVASIYGLDLSPSTRDIIKESVLTKGLNFQ